MDPVRGLARPPKAGRSKTLGGLPSNGMEEQTERSLIQSAKAGNREALGRLWDEFTPKLFGYLINTTHDHVLAEDLLQNTWLKAIANLPYFQLRDHKFGAWLFTIAHNECRQHWRKQGREVAFDITKHDQASDQTGKLETKILVEQANKLLSPDDRELIRLRFIADLPLNDIAKILKINFITVRVRLHRALARMRTAIINQTL